MFWDIYLKLHQMELNGIHGQFLGLMHVSHYKGKSVTLKEYCECSKWNTVF